MAMRRGALVRVRWLDAHAETGWGNVKDVERKPNVVLSVGFVVAHTDKALVLAADVDPKGRGRTKDCNRTLLIPIGMVQEVEEIEL